MRAFRTQPHPGFTTAYVTQYMDAHWDNIHLVEQSVLRTWLHPSFIPFPLLFTRVEKE